MQFGFMVHDTSKLVENLWIYFLSLFKNAMREFFPIPRNLIRDF